MMTSTAVILLFGTVLVSSVSCEVVDTAVNDNIRQPKFGFLTSTTNMIGSLAQDLISRSTSSSQVLSLNLTNLVILFVLKAIIFGASSFGFGYGSHGRSADQLINENLTKDSKPRSLLSEDELLLMLSYLQADSTEKYDCLHRVACEDPSRAKEYLLAGKVFLKGTQLIGSSVNNTKYANILSQLQEAVSYGLNGQSCSAKYQCYMKNK